MDPGNLERVTSFLKETKAGIHCDPKLWDLLQFCLLPSRIGHKEVFSWNTWNIWEKRMTETRGAEQDQ